MSLLRVHRRLIAWLAMLALGWAALAPAMAQAVVAASDDAGWVQLCTTTGMVWVQSDGPGAAADGATPVVPASDDASTMNCPWCTLHGGADTFAPPSPVALPMPERLADMPPAFYRAPTASFAWAAQHSRAPPVAS